MTLYVNVTDLIYGAIAVVVILLIAAIAGWAAYKETRR